MCFREMIPKWTLALSIVAALLHGKESKRIVMSIFSNPFSLEKNNRYKIVEGVSGGKISNKIGNEKL